MSGGDSLTTTREPRRRRAAQRRKAILVVDDERLIRWSIHEALKKDYAVRLAPTAEEGLRMLSRLKRLDAVLVDVRLPRMDGLEFARQACSKRPGLKVFLMTAFNQESAAREAFAVRAEGYLCKPFEFQTLKDMLVSHLSGSAP